MYKLIICDDDEVLIQYLSDMIHKCMPQTFAIRTFSSGNALSAYIFEDIKGNTDAIILDIDLKTMNGIELAKSIKASYPYINILFITGHIQYSQDIFETDPIYFLAKPLKIDKLKRALLKTISVLEKEKLQSISFESLGYAFQIPIKNIQFIQSNKRLVQIIEEDKNTELYCKLDDVAVLLPKQFLRCHKSFIVNMEKVRQFQSHGFLLHNGEVVPISQTKYAASKAAYIKYLGDKL
jgi:two-component system response regulator LytT